MNTYPINAPKNLHGRVIRDNNETVIFRNSDGVSETQRVVSRGKGWVVILSNKDGFLRLHKG